MALNIVPLNNIVNTIKEKLSLHHTWSGHSSADLTVDINLLADSYLAQRHHIYNPHHSQSFLAIDALSCGLDVRECPSSNFIPTNPDHARHILPRSRHETSGGILKTVGTAIPEHRGKLYQLWETVTVLTFLFRLHHLSFNI